MTFEKPKYFPSKTHENNYGPVVITKETLNLPEGKLETIEFAPSRPKSKTPVFFCPGWGGKADDFKDNLTALANDGRQIISVNTIHGIKQKIKETKKEARDLPEVELKKVAALIKTLEHKKISKIDAIGYSEGGLYVVFAALLYPEKFRNIVLVHPGGLTGKDNELRLVASFLKDMAMHFLETLGDKKKFELFYRIYGNMNKAMIKNPIKAAQEISAISRSQTPDILKTLQTVGIKMALIHGFDDRTFPMEKVRKDSENDQLYDFYPTFGSHVTVGLEPEQYSKLISEVLNDLENK